MSIVFLENNEILTIKNTSFEKNDVDDETINIFYVSIVNIMNVIFQRNNVLQTNKNNGYGGCLRTLNAHFRFFENVIIIDSISNQKAVGLKFIDDHLKLNDLLSTYGSQKVIIDSKLL